MPRLCVLACTGLIALALGGVPRESAAHPDSVRARQDLPTGIRLQTSRGILTIEPWQDGIMHVRFGTAGYTGNYNPAVIAEPQSVFFQIAETPQAYSLSTKRLIVRVNKSDATVAFLLLDGTALLEEAERDAGLGVRSPSRRRPHFMVSASTRMASWTTRAIQSTCSKPTRTSRCP